MQHKGGAAGFILLIGLCFGTLEVALRLGGLSFDGIQLTFLRFLIGGLLLLPLAVRDLKKRQYRPTAGDWVYMVLLGLLCVCVSMNAFQFGVMEAPASLAALILAANPVFTMIFAHFVASEKMTARKGVVLVICVAGLIVAAGPENLTGGSLRGVGILVFSSATFGLYTALCKRRVAAIGSMAMNCATFLSGAAGLLPLLLVTGRPVFSGITLTSLPVMLYLAVVVTALGYFSLMTAVSMVGASAASIGFFIKPVVAMIAAWLLLDEAITPNMAAGVALVLAGFVVNMLPQKTPAP